MSENLDKNLRIINNEKPKKSAIITGIYLKKEGMTRVLLDSGVWLPVTVATLIPTVILGKISDSKVKVLVNYGSRLNAPESGIVHKSVGDLPFEKGAIKTVDLYDNANISENTRLSLDLFQLGDKIDAVATSKGKGFEGKMKRWNAKGGRASHGASLDHRTGGSNGHFQNRSKTKPGCMMAGRLGGERVTMQNLQIVGFMNDSVLISGSVPGNKGDCFYVRRAKKI